MTHPRLSSMAVLVCVLGLLLTNSARAYAQGGGPSTRGSRPTVTYPLEFAVTPPVRELPPHLYEARGERETPVHRPSMRSGHAADPVVQTSTPTFASAQAVNRWEGLGAG